MTVLHTQYLVQEQVSFLGLNIKEQIDNVKNCENKDALQERLRQGSPRPEPARKRGRAEAAASRICPLMRCHRNLSGTLRGSRTLRRAAQVQKSQLAPGLAG